MMGGRMSPGLLGTCATLLVIVQAGPVLRFPRESEDYPNTDFSNYTANEEYKIQADEVSFSNSDRVKQICFSDQRVFQRGEEVPNAGPCEECRCEPPSIVCQMTKCPVNNNGCRTIQRPNHCCPDYNCECDYNGQLYNDGERIDLPEEPCQVCYCKGGDVMCTSVTCYHRDDCEPKHVPGQCCPKYEDCPIRDMEASNTEEKSVQTRSPNKTMNSNPNKEIQPWLLTKSVSQTSSSLAIPKLGETTTDGGNIIVSDWLVEQKTTEDFKNKQTDDPVFNNKESLGTTQSTKHTQSFENDGVFEIKPETVRPTPIEEVVFTRIDLPIRVEEEIIDVQTTSAPGNFDKNSSNITKLSETQDFNIGLKNASQTQPSNPHSKILEIKLLAVNKTDDGSRGVSLTESNNLGNDESTTTTSSVEIFPTQAKKESLMVELTKNNTLTGTPNLLIEEVINNDFEAKQIKNETESINEPPSTNISNDKDSKPEEITLYHLFGFDQSDEIENAKQTPTGKYSGEYLSTILNGEKDITYPTDPTSVETVFDHSSEYSAKDVSLKDNQPKLVIAHEVSQFENNGLTDNENKAQLNEASTVTENSEEKISTVAPKASMSKLQLQTEKLVLETNKGDKETTYLPETTTDIGTPAVFDLTTLKQLSDEKKDNLLSNVIEENLAGKLEYTETDGTTIRSSSNTNPVTTESSQSTTQKFLPENKGSYHDHEVQETTLNSHISKINDYTYSTASTINEEATTKYTLSEIEIILDEENDKTELGKSNSQESIAQDEVVLNLSMDEGSSENKEVILNHPPVLELNSHVPFLQIGGNENSEPSDIEYDQTTVVNKLDYVSSYKKEKIQDDKHTTNLVNEHTTNPPPTTITNIENIASLIENNTRKSNNSSDNASNKKVEEITIPTIAVVPLTPGDLKIIAEYLISEKIKPISKENNTTYFPNQWLKGNLTSDDNIASILSAANVSIGLMNQTNVGRMMEIIKKTNQSKALDIKYDKETRYKSNTNTLQNKYTVTSKSDNLHEKSSDDHELMKSTSGSLDGIDESIIVSDSGQPGAISNGILKTTEKAFNHILFTEHDFKTPTLRSDGTATEHSVFPQINKSEVSKAEKLLLREEEANHENTQVISRVSDSDENTSFDTNTTKNGYSKPSPNIPETTSFSAFS